MTTKIETHGMTIRTASQRVFVVVAGRPVAGDFKVWSQFEEGRDENGFPIYRTENGERKAGYVNRHYEPFIEIIARSDSYATAKKRAEKYGGVIGGFVAIIDTRTGEEV